MTAEWSEAASDDNGRSVSYLHPIQWTMQDLSIVACCPNHAPMKTQPVGANPYGGSPGYLPLLGQQLPAKHPVYNTAVVPRDRNNLTEAENLYVHLFQYSAGNFRPESCECVIHEVHNRLTGEAETKEHPQHTSRCHHHTNDTDHAVALKECGDKHKVHTYLMQALNLKEDEITVKYNEARELVIESSKVARRDIPNLDFITDIRIA